MTTTSHAHPRPTEPRLDFDTLVPRFSAALSRLDAVAGVGLDPLLRELVRIHASSLNGCAYCIDMHTKDARAAGETEQRLYALPAWRETPFFTNRERAALALTEDVTLMARDYVPAAAYEAVAEQLTPGEIAALLSLIVTINAWNAIGVTTRAWTPGSYQP